MSARGACTISVTIIFVQQAAAQIADAGTPCNRVSSSCPFPLQIGHDGIDLISQFSLPRDNVADLRVELFDSVHTATQIIGNAPDGFVELGALGLFIVHMVKIHC